MNKELRLTPEKVREKIARLIDVAGLYDSGVTPKGLADQILSLIQPLIEQAKEDEAKTIIKCLSDAKRVHPDWKIDDAIYLLDVREQTRQAISQRGKGVTRNGEV